jgi:DNA replication protein DnaC
MGHHVVLGDPSIADALLDRIVHTAHKIVLRGESIGKLRAKRRA